MKEPDLTDPDELALAWLYEREEGFTPERAQAFAAWRDRDPLHATALVRMERTLSLMNEAPAIGDRLKEHLAVAPAPAPRARLLPFPRWIATGAAAALVLGAATWWTLPRPAPEAAHYVTDTAAQRSLALADGSVLDLNVDSDVATAFTTRERRVTLHRGQAHFQVAHDASRPFLVTAAGVTVRAVGTAFDVRLADGRVDVLVTEGRVEVIRAVAPSAPTPPPLLQAGDRARVSSLDASAALKIDRIDPAAMAALRTWDNPLTTFTEVPLAEVITRFNRRNPTQLILADARLAERRIGGTVALDQVDAFVRLLEQDGDIIADRTSAGRISLRHAP